MRKKDSSSSYQKFGHIHTVTDTISAVSSTGQSGSYSSYSRAPFEDKIYNHSEVEKNSGDEVVIFLNSTLDLVLASCNLTKNKVGQLQVSEEELVEYCTEKELKKCLEIITVEDL